MIEVQAEVRERPPISSLGGIWVGSSKLLVLLVLRILWLGCLGCLGKVPTEDLGVMSDDLTSQRGGKQFISIYQGTNQQGGEERDLIVILSLVVVSKVV